MPGDRRSPIVTGDHRPVGAKSVEQPDQIAYQMEQSVLVDRFRAVGPAIAAHVRRHRTEPGFGEGRELMAPRITQFGKAVAQQDQRTRARFGEMHPDAVGRDRAVRRLRRHGAPPSLQRRRKKSIIAALTSVARSCWVQWPQPGNIKVPRSWGTKRERFGISWSIPGKRTTGSRSPAM